MVEITHVDDARRRRSPPTARTPSEATSDDRVGALGAYASTTRGVGRGHVKRPCRTLLALAKEVS
jgi:hypothetical protein